MDFAIELKNHLLKEENILDSIIASQKQVRLFVTKRDWMSLDSEIKSLELKANDFMILEDERNKLIEKYSLEIGEEKVKQICKFENLLKTKGKNPQFANFCGFCKVFGIFFTKMGFKKFLSKIY